MGVTEAVR